VHGVFEQKVSEHIDGRGCRKCSAKIVAEESKPTIDDVIAGFREIHGGVFDYSKVAYITAKDKVEIVCPVHGSFWQTPSSHIKGHGCSKCSALERGKESRLSKREVLQMFKEKHGDLFDYSKVIYKGRKRKVEITCLKHGSFWQTPSNHLNGNGCPKCLSSRGEIIISSFLKSMHVNYVRQKKFSACKNINPLRFDFYLPEYRLLIEYQGRQHYEAIDFFGGEKGLIDRQKRDQIKRDFVSKRTDLQLLEIKYSNKRSIPSILTRKLSSIDRKIGQLTLF
jgi:hypothetical protein